MLDLSPFSEFPDDARVWIHAADATLSDDTQQTLLNRLSTFFESWTSHEHVVKAAGTVLHNRFLVVAAVRADGGEISGCGIDDLAHAVDDAASALQIGWVPSLHVLYRDQDGSVTAVARPTFQERGKHGSASLDTHVFDPSLTQLGALRAGEFERPARESWHSQLLETPTMTA